MRLPGPGRFSLKTRIARRAASLPGLVALFFSTLGGLQLQGLAQGEVLADQDGQLRADLWGLGELDASAGVRQVEQRGRLLEEARTDPDRRFGVGPSRRRVPGTITTEASATWSAVGIRAPPWISTGRARVSRACTNSDSSPARWITIARSFPCSLLDSLTKSRFPCPRIESSVAPRMSRQGGPHHDSTVRPPA